MLRWILVVISALMLACVSLQPAVACEQASSAGVNVAVDGDDGQPPQAPELGIEMPALFFAPAAWPLSGALPVRPQTPASPIAAAPYLGAPLRPPCGLSALFREVRPGSSC